MEAIDTQPTVEYVDSLDKVCADISACRACPRLVKWREDVALEKRASFRDEDYWGKGSFPMEVSKVVFTPVRSAATRVAALLSGEVDFLLDPPVQDLERLSAAKGIVVRSGPENRTIFFGMNQGVPELRSSDVKGKNPFADKRVREAMNIAINREAVKRVVMRGQSVPAGIVAPPFIDGYDKALDVVPAPDVARAKALLAEAGYPNGFAVTLSCPNDRYVNDEAICQAVTGMFGQIGVKARLDARPKSIHFAELPKGDGNPAGAKMRDHTLWMDGREQAAMIYDRSKLRQGDIIKGPAIIVEMDSTTLVETGCVATVDHVGNILINLG